MIGAFRPSTSLSGGLLWKIPWRLSSTRKYRQRKRLQHVDHVVAVLDTALKRDAATYQSGQEALHALATASSSQSTQSQSTTPQEERRHGRGPKQGEFVPEMNPASTLKDNSPVVRQSSDVLLAEAARAQGTFKLLERWKAEMPTEEEMLPKNKYTIFDRKVRGYRKGVHKLPKWTRVSQRLNPPGY